MSSVLSEPFFYLIDYLIAAPFLRADEIELPDRPGVKISWWSYIKYFWILITRLPTVIRSRPSKAAARTTKVRFRFRRPRSISDRLVLQFIEQIRAKYEYTSVGSIG